MLGTKWSTSSSTGWVKLWVDDQLVHDASGQTLYAYGPGSCTHDTANGTKVHLKTGLYRTRELHANSVIYHHGLNMGAAYDEVRPRGLNEEFDIGVPVDWDVTGNWKRTVYSAACAPNMSAAGMAYNYVSVPRYGSCAYSGVGVLKSKPFRVRSAGDSITFYHWSETEQVVGFDVRTVSIRSPTVNSGAAHVLYSWCGPKATSRPLFSTVCTDTPYYTGEEFAIPQAYWGKNDVRVEFEFDTVDSQNNNGRGWLVDVVKLKYGE